MELVETPPSPIRMRLLAAICGLFAVALAWSWFGWIDIQAVAQGKVQPVGRTKLVQPLETGRVNRLLVENGSRVQAGDLVAELDATEITAERDAAAQNLASAEAEIVRRRAGTAAATQARPTPPASLEFPATVSDPALRAREQAVLHADLAKLRSTLDGLAAQVAEKNATERRLQASIAARARVIGPLKERLDMRQTLVDRGAGTRADLITAIHDYEEERTNLASEEGQLGEAGAAIASLGQKREEVVSGFLADNTSELADTLRRRDDLRQTLVKAEARLGHMRLFAPATGTVQELAVTSAGQVVTGGQQLMSIVPRGVDLEIEAVVLNEDIGFVEPGQEAILKVEAFPFTRYGTLSGRVTRVSTDAIDARQVGVRPGANTGTSTGAQAGAQPNGRMSGLVFPVTVVPNRTYMQIDGKRIPLTPGMAVIVEVRTGERRIINYILSPFVEVASRALHER
ncbi:HlyD family type I secretion periplasmic adaptor subunit [Methylobacterium fujisawaense]|uniref:HlyD family type I secretion periplasmic adaptor subunit n=1 Tax=Methylobacterium fujisawaense TaxID=107400 RepID=UPI0036FA8343